MLQLPLSAGNNSVETTIGDSTYLFEVRYNERFDRYSMNVYKDDELLVAGIRLLGGVDICDYTSLPLSSVYCINRNDYTADFGYDGLDEDGLVVVFEDGDTD